MAGLKPQVLTFGPRLYFSFRAHGGAIGALTTHIDNILGSGEQDMLHLAQKDAERRFGYLEVQQGRFARVGMEWGLATDFSAEWPRGGSRTRPTRSRQRPKCGRRANDLRG